VHLLYVFLHKVCSRESVRLAISMAREFESDGDDMVQKNI